MTSVTVSPGRRAAALVSPWTALLLVAAATAFGLVTVRAFNDAVEPELDNRSRLIGTVVRGNIQRALELGIPLEQIRGASRYLENVLGRFPEVSSISLRALDGRVVAVAERSADGGITASEPRGYDDGQRPLSASKIEPFSFPILMGNAVVGDIVIAGDPQFIDRQFRNIFLDVLVFILVALLVGFEVMLALIAASVIKPLDRLRALLVRQSAGDFSVRLAHRTSTSLNRVASRFSDHGVDLNARFASLDRAGVEPARLRDLERRFRLTGEAPTRLRFADVVDGRLPLFVFVLGSELSKSFLPLYVQRLAAGQSWLPESVIVSLPLVAYLLALMLLSPVAGALSRRHPARHIFLAALIPMAASQIGLSVSGSALEIVLWQGIAGAGFAVATIACQDHALLTAGIRDRARAVGGFIAVIISGTFCGTAMGGVMADRLGQQNVFLVGAGLIAAAGVLAYFMLSTGSAPHKPDPSPATPPSTSMFGALRNRQFAALLVGIAVPANMLVAAFLWYLVPLMLARSGSSPADIGRALMIYYLLVALLAPRVGVLSEGRNSAAVLALSGGLLSGLALLLAAQWGGFWPVVGAVAVAGLGQALLRAPVVELTLRLAESGSTPLAPEVMLNALRTLERAGSIIGLLLAAVLVQVAGYPGAATATGLVVLAGAVTFGVCRAARLRE